MTAFLLSKFLSVLFFVESRALSVSISSFKYYFVCVCESVCRRGKRRLLLLTLSPPFLSSEPHSRQPNPPQIVIACWLNLTTDSRERGRLSFHRLEEIIIPLLRATTALLPILGQAIFSKGGLPGEKGKEERKESRPSLLQFTDSIL